MANAAPITSAPLRVLDSCNPYAKSYRAPVLAEVESFLKRRQMHPTNFGECALGDPNLVRQLREGRDPRSKTVEIIRRFMRGDD